MADPAARVESATEREAQGLPPTIEDAEILARVARILAAALRGSS